MHRRHQLIALPLIVTLSTMACDRSDPRTDAPLSPEARLQIDLGNGCIDAKETGVSVSGMTVTGTSGDDLIDCRNNTTGLLIEGLAGNDTIEGGMGADSILGGPGCDLIRGNGDDDHIDGGAGHDRNLTSPGPRGVAICHGSLEGGPGNDFILGGSGHDRLAGDADTDTLIGGPGNDSCEAGGEPQDAEFECES